MKAIKEYAEGKIKVYNIDDIPGLRGKERSGPYDNEKYVIMLYENLIHCYRETLEEIEEEALYLERIFE